MREEYFVNIAFENSIKQYIENINNKDSIAYNTSHVVVIRLLALIYGKLDILNPYYLKNSIVFMNNLGKYGLKKSEMTLLLSCKQQQRQIRLLNLL